MIIGQKFQHSFGVDQDVYSGFLTTFKDHNPLHTNKDFAASYGFADTVMHGNILNGFLSYFIGELLPIKNVAIIKQEINYHSPVYLNDILSLTAVVTFIHESVNIIEMKFHFRNSIEKKVAAGKISIKVL
jgi:3-hydroxybutyryl-CoA dehydratase